MKTIEEMAREYSAEYNGSGFANEIACAYHTGAIAALRSQWRNVEIEMPEEYASVLLAYPDKSIIIGYYDSNCEMWRSAHSHEEICEPAAWRLIPEYKI